MATAAGIILPQVITIKVSKCWPVECTSCISTTEQAAPASALLLLLLPLPLLRVPLLLLVYPTSNHLARHENEVCECWRVDSASSTRAHDAADLL
jgi:hypothetical protein